MPEVEIRIPRGWEPIDVAEEFTAHLLGRRAFENSKEHGGNRPLGPFSSTHDKHTNKWVLDATNDFALRIEEGSDVGILWCRLPHQRGTIVAMEALLHSKHKNWTS